MEQVQAQGGRDMEEKMETKRENGGNVTDATAQAYALYKMLQGGVGLAESDEVDVDFGEQEEKQKKHKSTSTSASKSRKKTGDGGSDVKTKKTATRKKSDAKEKKKEVPKLQNNTGHELQKSQEIKVSFRGHDIPYKDQLWPVGQRTVTYYIELVEKTGLAKNLAVKFCPKERPELKDELVRKALSGEHMFYRIVTFENVPSYSSVLGYVRVTSSGSKDIRLDAENIKKSNVNYDALGKKVKEALKGMISKK